MNKKNINVLIIPASSEAGLEIYECLKYKDNTTLFGSDTIEGHASCLYGSNYQLLPSFDKDDFINELNKLIKLKSIDFIFPTNEHLSLRLQDNKNKIPCIVSLPGKNANLCCNKKQLYDYYKNKWFNPKMYDKNESISFPVFIKPIVGSGSKGARQINNANEMSNYYNPERDVVCELLPGDEYTVDCFTDNKGSLLYVKPRKRCIIKDGKSHRTESVIKTTQITKIAEQLNHDIEFNGMWFFQIKKSKEGIFKLLEVSQRAAGTMCLDRVLGMNLPYMTLSNYYDYPITINPSIDDFHAMVDRSLLNCLVDLSLKINRVIIESEIIENPNSFSLIVHFVCLCKIKGIKTEITNKVTNDNQLIINLSAALFDNIINDLYSIKMSNDDKTLIVSANHEKYHQLENNNCLVVGPETITLLNNAVFLHTNTY